MFFISNSFVKGSPVIQLPMKFSPHYPYFRLANVSPEMNKSWSAMGIHKTSFITSLRQINL
jgi:hypothetical protein